MTRSRDVSAVQNNLGVAIPPVAAGKNAVINGGFDIWQRGTSIALAASTSAANGYSADRWDTTNGANQAVTISRQATGDTTNLPNIQYCLRYQRNSGQTGTGNLSLVQSFESINSIPYAGKTVTFSFYARAGANYSATSNALGAIIITGTGTDQNAFSGFTSSATPINQNATLTTTWQRFSYTGTLASNITQIAVDFSFNPTGTAGANDYFEVTGVQLELGSSATPFSRAGGNIQGELAACQRYYWRITATDNAYASLSPTGYAGSTTQANFPVQFPVQMRVFPSSLDYSANLRLVDGVTATSVTSVTYLAGQSSTLWLVMQAVVASGLTQYRPYALQANNSTSSYIGFSAEL